MRLSGALCQRLAFGRPELCPDNGLLGVGVGSWSEFDVASDGGDAPQKRCLDPHG